MTEITAPRPVSFAALVQQFFTEYLITQCSRTVASYRDAMLLFQEHARQSLGKMPTTLVLNDIALDLILKFAARRDVSSFFAIEQALSVPISVLNGQCWVF